MGGFLHRLGRPERPSLRREIIEHLTALLNAYGGGAATVSSYGRTEFAAFVHELPGSIGAVENMLRVAIATYESRLKNVSVRFSPGTDPLRLDFDVSARASDEPGRTLEFRASLGPTGRISLT